MGNLTITRNGQVLTLHASRTKDGADTVELRPLRHFLERSEKAGPGETTNEAQWRAIIDHHSARIYRSVATGSVPHRDRPLTNCRLSRRPFSRRTLWWLGRRVRYFPPAVAVGGFS